MGCNCGGRKAGRTQYEVKTPKGSYTVNSLAEAKIKIAIGGGGTYKEVSAKE